MTTNRVHASMSFSSDSTHTPLAHQAYGCCVDAHVNSRRWSSSLELAKISPFDYGLIVVGSMNGWMVHPLSPGFLPSIHFLPPPPPPIPIGLGTLREQSGVVDIFQCKSKSNQSQLDARASGAWINLCSQTRTLTVRTE